MSHAPFAYETVELTAPRLGLIALQSDETIEGDMRRLLPSDVELFVSRVRSDTEVTSATLSKMEAHLSDAASLFPQGAEFEAIGYGCTSGTAQIGAQEVASRVRSVADTKSVTQPLSALVAACRHLDLRRLALLSPYVAEVSQRMQVVLATQGIEIPVFGSFHVSTEAMVVRISPASQMEAARTLMQGAEVDGLFLSCTNLRTLDIIDPLEKELDMPVLSSNQVLAWHMMRGTGVRPPKTAPGKLMRS